MNPNHAVLEKLECLGHIQKCADGCLRNLKSTTKLPLVDGKTLGGKCHLKDKLINKHQNYFGSC